MDEVTRPLLATIVCVAVLLICLFSGALPWKAAVGAAGFAGMFPFAFGGVPAEPEGIEKVIFYLLGVLMLVGIAINALPLLLTAANE